MQEKSSSSVGVKVFKLDYSYVLREVKKYAEKIVGRGLAKLVVLFGSLAKGTYTPFSDIDILIVVEDLTKNPLERIPIYIDPKLPLDVEPRVFTVEEFFKIFRERRRFAEEIIFHGLFLAGDERLLEEAKKRYLDKKV
ncbi:MAG: nucleotidyltransferase domain-containing protein [Nitrososphaeria archaeon]|nr:nucleotidyltransferase domain-containing protein [Nitrososphaeria archaeon]